MASNDTKSILTPMPDTSVGLPGFGPPKAQGDFDPKKYRVRYKKFNIGDDVDTTELESIETRGMRAEDIILLGKEKFTFATDYYLVLTYLEKIPE